MFIVQNISYLMMYFYKLKYISSNCFMLNIKTRQNIEKPKPSRIKESNFIRVIRNKNLFVFSPLYILKFTFWSKNYIWQYQHLLKICGDSV